MTKFDDQLFLGARATAKLRRRRRAPKPTWPDGPLDPVPGGGTITVRLRDGRQGVMPLTYDVLHQKAVWVMARHDELNRSKLRRFLYEKSLDRHYKEPK
jgi:hypothetical protein